jgi:hypothetical protein
VGFAATVIGVAMLYVSLFLYQLGAPVAAEYWVHEAKTAKLLLAARAPARRVLIVGGSGALFGVDSTLIEREIDVRTVNLAIHAGLSLPYIFEYTKPLLRSGDVVIPPLEFEYLARAYRYDWFRSNVMAWDPAYFSTLRPLDQARFILAVPAKRVINGAIAQVFEVELRQERGRIVRQPALITRDAAWIWQSKSYRDRPITYSLSGLDDHGDMQNNRGSRYTGPAGSALSLPFEPAADTWEELRGFARYCRRRGISVFFAWPAIMNEPGLVEANPMVQWNIEQIVKNLRNSKIGVLGRPQDYYLDRGYFFDTKNHLNEEGRAIRTQQLVKDLRDALAASKSGLGP